MGWKDPCGIDGRECETRWRGRQVSSAAALLELLSAPARARLIAPDLLSGDSGCGDTSFRLLTEFGRLDMLERLDDICEEQGRKGEATELRKEAKRSVAATRVTRQKIGRNEPCPCGSGKKFKKCCGA